MVWAVTSAFYAVIAAGAVYVQGANLGRTTSRSKAFLRLIRAVQGISVGMMLINILNFLGVFFHREAGPVIAALVFTLALTGYLFSRLLLSPIWRRVRVQEADAPANATAS